MLLDLDNLLDWAWAKCDGDHLEYARVLRWLGYSDETLREELLDYWELPKEEVERILEEVRR